MIVTLATLRAAGLTEAQIMRVVEAVDNERVAAKREQNRKASQKHRARQKNAADAADAADAQVSKEPSFLPNQGKKEGRKKHLLAENWKLSNEDRAYAQSKGWPDNRIEIEGERFRLYYVTKGTPIASDHLTWCKWVMSPIQNGGGQYGAGRQKGDRRHSISATFDDIFAKLEGGDGASVVPFQANPRLLPNRRRE